MNPVHLIKESPWSNYPHYITITDGEMLESPKHTSPPAQIQLPLFIVEKKLENSNQPPLSTGPKNPKPDTSTYDDVDVPVIRSTPANPASSKIRSQFEHVAVVVKLSENLHAADNNELCIGEYPLETVSTDDLKPDGKYRAICKIFVNHSGGRYSGTGFLIDNRTVVTVAHIVGGHYTTEVSVHIGYWGGSHIQHEVQIGEYVAIPWWYFVERNDGYDLAVVRVKKPFEHIHSYLQFGACPPDGVGRQIAVVGYPCEVPNDWEGKYMYESQGLGILQFYEAENTLVHRLDTHPGNSGSPVLELREGGRLCAIGVHRAGRDQTNVNLATTFGDNGSRILALVRSIETIADEDTEDCIERAHRGGQ